MTANSFLKESFKDDETLKTLDQGYDTALKALVKTMETTTPSSKKIEIISISFNMVEEIAGKTLKDEEIKELLKRNELTA